MKHMNQSEFLTLILERPGLYIGHGSVVRAKAFVDGYSYCCGEADANYVGFSEWIAERFSLTTTHDWASIVTFMGGSEASSFQLLKELWQEYNDRESST
jgi:hypothetical protein